ETLRLTQLRLDAPETRLAGDLTIGLKDRAIAGTIGGEAKNLAVWAKLLGSELGGAVTLKGALRSPRGQKWNLTLTGSNLPLPGVAAQHLQVSAELTDLFANPGGRANLALDRATIGDASLDELRLQAKSERPGRFAVEVNAHGKATASFTLASAGAVTVSE